MKIQGSIHKKDFQYVQVSVMKCDESSKPSADMECASEIEMNKKQILRIALPEPTISYEKKRVIYSLNRQYSMQLDIGS